MAKASKAKNISAGVSYKKIKAPMVDPPGKGGKGAYSTVQLRTLGNMKKGGKVSKKK
jgi:hypothetical protein